MKVTLVGNKTYYGRISKEVSEKKPDSPLKLRLRGLAKLISRIGYIGAALGAFSYLFSVIFIDNNFNLNMISKIITNIPLITSYIMYALTLAVTIIIVSVPEGLPMMITLVLSSNMKKMLKSNVLVRKLVGIETAGSLNVLFFDKTGTITKGKPLVIGFLDSKLNLYHDLLKLKRSGYFDIFKMSLILNNESTLDDKKNVVGGNSTDKALLNFMKDELCNHKVISDFPFDSKNKYSKAIVNYNNKELILLKGAPEMIFSYCNSYYDVSGEKRTLISKKEIDDKVNKYVEDAVRVLCVATSDVDFKDNNFHNLCLLGFILIKDEVRSDAYNTINEINNAGIKTVMITGDNIKTASSIAKEVGLIKNASDLVISSSDLARMSDNEVRRVFSNLCVIARALPTDKSRLVNIAQSLNYVSGMTGDGVNDAPALKKANVGFAMGSGSEVAKEASDIVILDDNIKSICSSILYGRTIFKSIRKFIIFQLSLNICALLVSVIAPIFGIETPITVIQMLWINMIMDTLAAFAFSYEPPLKEYMEEPPKDKDEPIMNKYMASEILVSGVYSSILCLLFLKLPFFSNLFRVSSDNRYLMTAFFSLFIFLGIFNSFNARTSRLHILANLFKNKVFLITFLIIIIIQIILIYYGGSIFRTVGLTFRELEIMLAFAFSIIPIDFIRKLILKSKGIKSGV